MSDREVIRHEDEGRLTSFGVPEGVAWLDFLFLAESARMVPFSVKELIAKKGAELAIGDFFSAQVNLLAASPADVYPDDIKFEGHFN